MGFDARAVMRVSSSSVPCSVGRSGIFGAAPSVAIASLALTLLP
jgi:hypothetical protein